MKFFRSLSARFHLAMGLSSLTVSVLLLAIFIKLIPDVNSLRSETRASLAEAVASVVSILLKQDNFEDISGHLGFLVERNEDLLGTEVERVSDDSIVTFGDKAAIDAIKAKTQALDSDEKNAAEKVVLSTPDMLRVPLKRNGEDWGSVTLYYNPINGTTLLDKVRNFQYAPIMFVGMLCFLVFYWYLGRMLQQLNPSTAVPGRVRSALDTIAESLLVINSQEEVVLANKAFADLVGIEPEDMIGMMSTDFEWERVGQIAESTEKEKTNEKAQADETGAAEESEPPPLPWTHALSTSTTIKNSIMWLKDSEGKRRKFLVNCSPVMGNENTAGGVLISLDDVTLLEEIELELIESKEQAELANMAKSSFLSNMSHEIRTPMTAILGFTEVLQRGYGTDPTATKRHLNTIASSGSHLLELINDVLDLSKVESGVLEIEEIECKPHVIANDVVSVLRVKAVEKGIDLEIDVDGSIPTEICSDPSRLRQILTNLIGNAIKFTSEGLVKLELSTYTERDETYFKFNVIDSGIGMTEAQCGTIFEAFVQADTSITRRFGGTGLGLSISKKLAIALGGDITVSSVEGEGSEFLVCIPANIASDVRWINHEEFVSEAETMESGSNWEWKLSDANILVVDDAKENRELLSLVLEEMGVTVDTAENGQVGVDKFLASDFDVVLMDIQMPVLDGYGAVAKIRESGSDKPVVALTANAMKGFEKNVLERGFSHYQTKPIDIFKLGELLASLLGGKKVKQGEASFQPIPASESAQLPMADAVTDKAGGGRTLKNELIEKNPKFKVMADEFTKKLQIKVPEMREALNTGDMDTLASLSHWLKGSGGSVGYTDFTLPAKTLENAVLAGETDGLNTPLTEIEQLVRQLDEDFRAADTGTGVSRPVKDNSEGLGESESKATDDSHSGMTSIAGEPIESSLPVSNPKFKKIVCEFGRKLAVNLDKLESAIATQDFDEIKSLSHWLKGSGGNVGFHDFTKPAGRLQTLAEQQDLQTMDSLFDQLRGIFNRIQWPEDHADNDSLGSDKEFENHSRRKSA